jgi:hypothetical protein
MPNKAGALSSEPRRSIDKQEAIRHLLHAAIRLILKKEDPFAIHMLVQSADKLLIDFAKKSGQELRVDWDLYIKSEHQTAFFEKHRAIYNYFKHADRDFGTDLPVHDIMMLNIMTLFICVANYVTVFKHHTNHMTLFQAFVMALRPQIISDNAPQKLEFLRNISRMEGMTPASFWEFYQENQSTLPTGGETAEDLQDIFDFYHLSFAELRAGLTRSPRLFRIREY